MSQSLVRFLQKKGVIELLCVMDKPRNVDPTNPDKFGSSFTELLGKTRLSRATLADRLQAGSPRINSDDREGTGFTLWGPDSMADDNGSRHDGYVLYPPGQQLHDILYEHRLPSILEEIREREREWDRQYEAVIEKLDEKSLDELHSDTR